NHDNNDGSEDGGNNDDNTDDSRDGNSGDSRDGNSGDRTNDSRYDSSKDGTRSRRHNRNPSDGNLRKVLGSILGRSPWPRVQYLRALWTIGGNGIARAGTVARANSASADANKNFRMVHLFDTRAPLHA